MVDKNSNNEAWWQPALVISTQVSAWIAAPIIIALFIGKALDKKYGTEPWIFLGLTAVAFAISCFGIVMITVRYTRKLEKELQEKKKLEEESKKDNNQKN